MSRDTAGQTYVERNRGKLAPYRIGQGRHSRYERTEGGSVVVVNYTDVFSGGTNVILLTAAGAEALHHLKLSSAEVKAVDVADVEVPADWKDMTPNKRFALAKKIGGKAVKKEEADAVIEQHLSATKKAEADAPDSTDTD